MNWIVIRKISWFFIASLLLAVVADSLVFACVEYGHKSTDFVGCYAYDAMLIGYECQGFVGHSVVSAWLNWPLWLVFAPMFAIFSFKSAAVAVLVWLPLVTYVISVIKIRSNGNV